ncbi:MAG: DegT/DnrJ/EryC1/StrS family aminotransferase [Candidatus Omnitrophica bacterium]|nr:DegT/DnrJ/EryC1/StrS family aminotransferase [Candidatus Omnitrophota bacterium]
MVLNRKYNIPFHKPSFSDEEIREVTDSIKTGWLSTGPKTAQFEAEFAEFLGVPFAVAVNSGSAALHLALKGVGIKEGDEVITTPFTFVATAEAILQCGAKPVFVDCDPSTFNIQADQIERKMTRKTKAILPVHFGGQSCNMDQIMKLAAVHHLKVIEDAAHAFQTRYHGRAIGTIGDITCFSFYATKTLAVGEGGMLVTNSSDYAQKARLLSLHGMTKNAWRREVEDGNLSYDIVMLGHKYNLGDLHAALGIHQLRKANGFLNARRNIARAYFDGFKCCELLELMPVDSFDDHSWHLFVIKLKLEELAIPRDAFRKKMEERGIRTSIHFMPLHLFSFFKEQFEFKANDFPNALSCYERIVSLPIYPDMTEEELAWVIESTLAILEENRKPMTKSVNVVSAQAQSVPVRGE